MGQMFLNRPRYPSQGLRGYPWSIQGWPAAATLPGAWGRPPWTWARPRTPSGGWQMVEKNMDEQKRWQEFQKELKQSHLHHELEDVNVAQLWWPLHGLEVAPELLLGHDPGHYHGERHGEEGLVPQSEKFEHWGVLPCPSIFWPVQGPNLLQMLLLQVRKRGHGQHNWIFFSKLESRGWIVIS